LPRLQTRTPVRFASETKLLGTFLEIAGILLGAATAGTLLSLLWYWVTQRDPPDKDTVIFFSKLFFGGAMVTILSSVLLKIG
jgi:hypothetical protein